MNDIGDEILNILYERMKGESISGDFDELLTLSTTILNITKALYAY
jgi:hypothetical protein